MPGTGCTVDAGRLSVDEVITTGSLLRLGLKMGRLIAADIKAPWIMLQNTEKGLAASAGNILKGVVERIDNGEINTELMIRFPDDTKKSPLAAMPAPGASLWCPGGLFEAFSVVLLSD